MAIISLNIANQLTVVTEMRFFSEVLTLFSFHPYLFIYLFVVYLTTLPVAQTIYRRMVGRQVNNELKRTWKEVDVAYLKLLSLSTKELIINILFLWIAYFCNRATRKKVLPFQSFDPAYATANLRQLSALFA
jgi:hypothetical protein